MDPNIDVEALRAELQNHISMMDNHQFMRRGGQLLARARDALRQQFNTTAVNVTSQGQAEVLCRMLVQASQWFQVTPLPDDLWEVRVKKENKQLLDTFLVSMGYSQPHGNI